MMRYPARKVFRLEEPPGTHGGLNPQGEPGCGRPLAPGDGTDGSRTRLYQRGMETRKGLRAYGLRPASDSPRTRRYIDERQ